MASDQGPFSSPSADQLGKEHTFCTAHKTTSIFPASAGLNEPLKTEFAKDIYKLIYEIDDRKELQQKITSCLATYSQSEAAVKFIRSIDEVKDKLCRAYTQDIFTMNRTTT